MLDLILLKFEKNQTMTHFSSSPFRVTIAFVILVISAQGLAAQEDCIDPSLIDPLHFARSSTHRYVAAIT